MCVEAFVIGKAITISFLHEQIWFEVGHRHLKVTEVCDWFIHNDDEKDIEMVRIQFPYFIHPDDITTLSGLSDSSSSKYDWFCDFKRVEDFPSLVEVGHGVLDDRSVAYGDGRISAQVLDGRVLLPATERVPNYIDSMKSLKAMVVDINLSEPIKRNHTGWLRLKVAPQSWPAPEDIVDRPPLQFLGASHEFLARLTILSPRHLRMVLRKAFRSSQFGSLESDLVRHGWETDGTLTRIVDHRLSLILPRAVGINVVSYPQSTVVPIAPYRIHNSQDHFAQHFATGSNFNRSKDVTIMANRICDYIESVMMLKSASLAHLVDRFGGDQHEVIGNFIDEMSRAGVLVCTASEEKTGQPYYRVSEKREQAMLELRKNYSALRIDHDGRELGNQARNNEGGEREDAKRYRQMRDLHPFTISFTLTWSAFSDEQERRMRCLSKLIDGVTQYNELEPSPREAVLVCCSNYKHETSHPQLVAIYTALEKQLRSRARFRVRVVHNPDGTDQIEAAVCSALSRLDGAGVFLFWFIGHGYPNYNNTDLHMLHTNSQERVGMTWSRMTDLMQRHPGVAKLAVIDCCHAGIARKIALPDDNTFLWTTAAEYEEASAEVLGMYDNVAGRRSNFSSHVAAFLDSGSPELEDVLTFEGVFEEVHDQCSCNSPKGFYKRAGNDREIQFALNAVKLRKTVSRLVDRLSDMT